MIFNYMLDLDSSILMVFALIWILMMILNRLFFRPVGKVIQERESKIEQDNQEIERLTEDLEAKTQRIESMLKAAQKDAGLICEKMIRQGETAREQLIVTAREKAKTMVDRKMIELEKEIIETEQKIVTEIEGFSKQIREIFI